MMIFLGISIFLVSALFFYKRCSSYVSKQWDNKKKIFYNPWQIEVRKVNLFKILQFICKKRAKWKEQKVLIHCGVKDRESELTITNIGHATLLIQANNLNIITDPVFSDCAGPFGKLGPKRVKEPGLPIELLPPIDVVFISHNHYDHLDAFSVKKIDSLCAPIFIVPLGVGRTLKRWRLKGTIIELDWWQSYHFASVKFVSVPAQHWSRRGLFDKNATLWMGGIFLFEKNKSVFFAGDTGFGEHFVDISKQYPNIDIGLLPIGSYKPIEIMKNQHMGPSDAVRAQKVMGIAWMIPIHFDVFALGAEAYEEAKLELKQESKQANSSVYFLEVGEVVSSSNLERA
jgi:L-ascorbate metabolism protein UlaG (beta-lactamase superfamily)